MEGFGGPEEAAHAEGDHHGQHPPSRHSQSTPAQARSADRCPGDAEGDESEHGGDADDDDPGTVGGEYARQQGDERPEGEARSRSPRRLGRSPQALLGLAELVPQVCTDRIAGHESPRHLVGQLCGQPALAVDPSELDLLDFRAVGQLAHFPSGIGGFGVGLRTDGHVFADGHRQGAGREPGKARSDHRAAGRSRAGDADHE